MKHESKYEDKPIFINGTNEVGILLLHGWTAPPEEFLLMAKYLNSFGYTVSAPLLRGHGTKPEDLLGVTWKDWLEDARRALVELEKTSSKIFVGGVSMGGDLAMHLSEEKSIAGVISLGGAVRYKFRAAGKIALFFMGLTKEYRKKYFPPWVHEKITGRNVYMYYPIQNAKEVLRLTDETLAILPRIKKPILIMQSTTDHMVSKKSPQMIFDGVNSIVKEIYWVKNSYHVFIGRKKVWKKMREFIESVAGHSKA